VGISVSLFSRAVKGLDDKNCLRVRKLAAHVAAGPRKGWWKTADQAVAGFTPRNLAALKASTNWQTIMDLVAQIIAEIQAGKA